MLTAALMFLLLMMSGEKDHTPVVASCLLDAYFIFLPCHIFLLNHHRESMIVFHRTITSTHKRQTIFTFMNNLICLDQYLNQSCMITWSPLYLRIFSRSACPFCLSFHPPLLLQSTSAYSEIATIAVSLNDCMDNGLLPQNSLDVMLAIILVLGHNTVLLTNRLASLDWLLSLFWRTQVKKRH